MSDKQYADDFEELDSNAEKVLKPPSPTASNFSSYRSSSSFSSRSGSFIDSIHETEREEEEKRKSNGNMEQQEPAAAAVTTASSAQYLTESPKSVSVSKGSVLPVKYDITHRSSNNFRASPISGELVHKSNYTSVELLERDETSKSSFRNAENTEEIEEEGLAAVQNKKKKQPPSVPPLSLSLSASPKNCAPSDDTITATSSSILKPSSFVSRADTIIGPTNTTGHTSSAPRRRSVSAVPGEDFGADRYEGDYNPQSKLPGHDGNNDLESSLKKGVSSPCRGSRSNSIVGPISTVGSTSSFPRRRSVSAVAGEGFGADRYEGDYNPQSKLSGGSSDARDDIENISGAGRSGALSASRRMSRSDNIVGPIDTVATLSAPSRRRSVSAVPGEDFGADRYEGDYNPQSNRAENDTTSGNGTSTAVGDSRAPRRSTSGATPGQRFGRERDVGGHDPYVPGEGDEQDTNWKQGSKGKYDASNSLSGSAVGKRPPAPRSNRSSRSGSIVGPIDTVEPSSSPPRRRSVRATPGEGFGADRYGGEYDPESKAVKDRDGDDEYSDTYTSFSSTSSSTSDSVTATASTRGKNQSKGKAGGRQGPTDVASRKKGDASKSGGIATDPDNNLADSAGSSPRRSASAVRDKNPDDSRRNDDDGKSKPRRVGGQDESSSRSSSSNSSTDSLANRQRKKGRGGAKPKGKEPLPIKERRVDTSTPYDDEHEQDPRGEAGRTPNGNKMRSPSSQARGKRGAKDAFPARHSPPSASPSDPKNLYPSRKRKVQPAATPESPAERESPTMSSPTTSPSEAKRKRSVNAVPGEGYSAEPFDGEYNPDAVDGEKKKKKKEEEPVVPKSSSDARANEAPTRSKPAAAVAAAVSPSPKLGARGAVQNRSPSKGRKKQLGDKSLPRAPVGSSERSPRKQREDLLAKAADLKTQIRGWNDRIAREEEEYEVNVRARQKERDERRRETGESNELLLKLRTDNEVLERAYEGYSEDGLGVASLLAKYSDELERALSRLKDAIAARRALENRDKRAAHAIGALNRRMPKEEIVQRQVNEGFYVQASVDNQVRVLRERVVKTKESRKLMRKKCVELEQQVAKKQLADINPKEYERLLAIRESNKRTMEKSKAAIAVYTNVVSTAERRYSRSRAPNATSRSSLVVDDHSLEVEALVRRRMDLEEEAESVKVAIRERTRQIATNLSIAAGVQRAISLPKQSVAVLAPSSSSVTPRPSSTPQEAGSGTAQEKKSQLPASASVASNKKAVASPQSKTAFLSNRTDAPTPLGTLLLSVDNKKQDKPQKVEKKRQNADETPKERKPKKEPQDTVIDSGDSTRGNSLDDVLDAIDAESQRLHEFAANNLKLPMNAVGAKQKKLGYSAASGAPGSSADPLPEIGSDGFSGVGSRSTSNLRNNNVNVRDTEMLEAESSGRLTPMWLR